MAHGFGKLEWLFSGHRRKGQGRQKSQQPQKTTIVTRRRPSSPMFPSPPYLRPTSTPMTPRDAQIDGPAIDKGRSQSVPTLQEALRKRSSDTSSITIVNRPSRSDTSTPPLPRRKNSRPKSRPSRFRFPEDSLIRNDRPKQDSGGLTSYRLSRGQSPQSCATQNQGLLNWTPKHISLLFNPLEFTTSSNDSPTGPGYGITESTLLPSPDFMISNLSPDKLQPAHASDNTVTTHSRLSTRKSAEKLALNLRKQPLSSCQTPPIESPSESDTRDHHRKSAIHRSMSLGARTPPCPDTPCTTPTSLHPINADSNLRRRKSARETWGNRLEDPRLDSPTRNGEDTPRPKLRKSASTSTLCVLTPKPSKIPILKEPTFDDFCALSDDDIAESRPPTPAYDLNVPPTPPPRRNTSCRRKSRLPQAVPLQHAAFNPTLEEITPPDTPIDGDLVTLTYTPTSPRDAVGALWAAELARKYNFAVLYVLSLWPVGGDCYRDAQITASVNQPKSTTAVGTMRVAAPGKDSQVSGRLLAAYGLNEVPSPFEIVTDAHLSALNCDHWNEYRSVDARPDDISRGWIRTFYSDYLPVPLLPKDTDSPAGGYHPKNRGIVFAAYSKQASNPIIPMGASPKQDLLLGQLDSDARALVEALVMQPSNSKRVSAVCADLEKSDPHARSSHLSSQAS
ncbi:hypothetical protein F4777DRAFT_238750 [Nemania sp. FL0916]|nr:hypothetical protein F4777DRAFT_238750 [Nemania sp. FL0916]